MKMTSSAFCCAALLLTVQTLFAHAQTNADIYKNIKEQPSKIRWCLPQAGTDPAHIIEGRCRVYRDCLGDLGLGDAKDQNALGVGQVDGVRRCQQALFNAARMNPLLKGSYATQQWLQHDVYPGTEAKSFPVPSNFVDPR